MSNRNISQTDARKGSCSALRQVGMILIKYCLKRIFRDVPRVSTHTLNAWLGDPNRIAPLLLDVRSRAEYDTSFIGDARWADPNGDAETIAVLKAELTADPRPVVVYCSAGYRSARFARRLLAAGVTPVYNLEGSIFAWANEGRELNSARGTTPWVHPYNALFGALLAKSHRARAKRP